MPPPPNLAELLDTKIFPGMSMRESRILHAWLERRGADWDAIRVDVKLGPGKQLQSPHFDQKFREDWERRTRARPDCVATKGNTAAIVEAKEYATNEAIWQVLSYVDLYKGDFPGVTVQPIVICEDAAPTALVTAGQRGVQVLKYVIPPDEPLATGTEVPAS